MNSSTLLRSKERNERIMGVFTRTLTSDAKFVLKKQAKMQAEAQAKADRKNAKKIAKVNAREQAKADMKTAREQVKMQAEADLKNARAIAKVNAEENTKSARTVAKLNAKEFVKAEDRAARGLPPLAVASGLAGRIQARIEGVTDTYQAIRHLPDTIQGALNVAPATHTAPAGWYDDGSGRQRWWDGNQWTDKFAE